jgi:hypothetical protein
MKQFKKEKWQVFGTTRTLDVALLSHYDKLNNMGEDGNEIMGVATKVKSKNIGHQMAINNACLTYAQQAGSHLKGRVVSDIMGNATDTDGEFDKMYSAYERLVEKEIRGELKESFTLNESAADMLRLLCEGKDPKTIAQDIANLYDAPVDMVTKDVMKFIDKLQQKDLI